MAASLLVEETNKIRVSLGLKPIPVSPKLEHASPTVAVKAKATAEVAPNLETTSTYDYKVPLLAEQKLAPTSDWLNSLGTGSEPSAPTSAMPSKAYEKLHTDDAGFSGSIGHSVDELAQVKNGDIFTLNDQNVDDIEDPQQELSHAGLAHLSRIKRDTEPSRRDAGFDQSIANSGSVPIKASEAKLIATEPPQTEKRNRVDVSLFDGDLSDDDAAVNQDYAAAAPIKMKKLKKTKAGKGTRRAREIDEISANAPLVAVPLDTDIVEDETAALEAELARTRQLVQKNKRMKMLNNDLEREKAQFDRLEAQRELEGNIYASTLRYETVISDTSEFLRLVGNNDTKATGESSVEATTEASTGAEHATASAVTSSGEIITESESASTPLTEESTEQLNQGLGSALAYLRKNHALPEKTLDQQLQKQRQRQRAAKQAELLRLRIAIEERVLHQELATDKTYMNLPKLERPEYFEARLQERIEEKGLAPLATGIDNEDYDPEIQVSYRDESGKLLDTKGAFKQLSHHFHGAQKTKKRARPFQRPPTSKDPRAP